MGTPARRSNSTGLAPRVELVVDVAPARLAQEQAQPRRDQNEDRAELEGARVGRRGVDARALGHRAGPAGVEHAADLLDFNIPTGEVTDAGLATNVSVGVRYIAAWLAGTGAAALDNLMEDAATAEISRSQVWQWVKTGTFSRDRVLAELQPWRAQHPQAAQLFEQVALADEFVEFLTIPAYQRLA